MRITILLKLTIVLLILVTIPLIGLGIISITDVTEMENISLSSVKDINEVAVNDSITSLNYLGATIIKNQAINTEKLIELYLKTHPEKTASDLISDQEFQSLAIQPVGEKGYTTLILTKTQTMLAHPNTTLLGKEMIASKDKPEMKDWWRIVENTWSNNVDSYGYYKWPEADGSYSDKYMYLAVLDEKIDGENVSVAATTYIEEFNAPAKETQTKLTNKSDIIQNEIKKAKTDIQQSTIKFLITALLVTIISAIFFAKTISDPVRKLKSAADKITNGEANVVLPRTKGNDEIAQLTSSVEMLITALKNKK
jgi:HAMP domain-containing protein